jgi:protein tyrosine phosphatase (PTP) superfamily phosphohydrolase (DUF442 family)
VDLNDIQNFLEITPSLLTAGQPFEEQFELIQQAGCVKVINLALSTSWDAVPDEEERFRALGLDYLHIPVEWERPTRADLLTFFAALEQTQGQKTFVHCARNMRVSAFVFLYRVLRLHQDPQACRLDLEKIWQPNETWSAFIADNL